MFRYAAGAGNHTHTSCALLQGRFVKREELRRMLEAEAEEASPRSDASAFDCEAIWPYTE